PRGGKIAVSIARDDDAAIIRVEDTGIGIAADMLQKIFEPFTQADNSLARSWGGLGLGLAFVKGLVEMHGGSVSAASEGAGKGSTFTVSLPLLPAKAPRTTGATAEEVSAAACCSAPEPRPAAEAIKQ
ncbi:ATP-binding protein, partial [Haliangium sp. UPWRP_2]|uniref:sensor histidine kinase n=1 Tax=Haliangium sp. UPWRP_2 TaxID=1931276 RepID=UPI001E3D0412